MIEEGLIGNEISILAICDGIQAVPLAPAQDYKRLLNNDEGPNTEAWEHIPQFLRLRRFRNTNNGRSSTTNSPNAHHRGIDYRGVLYAGIMNTASGPKFLNTMFVSETPKHKLSSQG